MKSFNDCTYCYLKQMLSVFRTIGCSENVIRKYIPYCISFISSLDYNNNPSMNSSLAILEASRLCGDYDPFKRVKKESNDFALSIEDELRLLVNNSTDKLLMAFKIAVAGNIIDAGITPDFDVNVALSEILDKNFDYNDYDLFQKQVKESKNILILGDNAGEIVFDKFLVEELISRGLTVTYAVKPFNILNDATLEDVEYVGMHHLVNIINTGSKFVGATLKECSDKFICAMSNADIIIAKGQANYESLNDSEMVKNKIYFVLRAKCQCIAEHVGVKLNNIILKKV